MGRASRSRCSPHRKRESKASCKRQRDHRRPTAPINRSHSSKLPRKPSSQAVLKPLRRSIRQCEAAAEIRDGPETPDPRALGGSRRCVLVLAAIIAAFVLLLRRPARSALAIVEKSIAVLPFENRSRDPDNAYFADGIQDEILTRLSKIADLKVMSRKSTQHYKSAQENLSEIGKQLGVAHILEGSVQKSGDSVRVNVQLIEAGPMILIFGPRPMIGS